MEIKIYKTEWQDKDNHILLARTNGSDEILGCLEMTTYKKGEHEDEAYLWNLYIEPFARHRGYAASLIEKAIKIARQAGCTRATLKWDIKESSLWVYDWYICIGFEEIAFVKGCAIMERKL